MLAVAVLAACAPRPSAPRDGIRPSSAASSPRLAVRRVEIPPVDGHTRPVGGIAVSPSGRLFVTVAADRTISVWNVATGARVRTLDVAKACAHGLLRATDEETALAACDDGTLRSWDLRTGLETRVEKAHPGAFTAVMDRAGRRALTAAIGMDERGADGRQRIFLWDLDRVERVGVVAEIPGHVAQIAWSNDGRYALVRTYRLEDGIALIDVESGKTLRRFEPKSENAVDGLAFDPSGRRAVISHAGGPTLVFDTATGRLEQRSERGLPPFVVGPGGQLLSMDRGLVHRDLQRLDVPTEVGWRGSLTASSWTPDRAHVAVAGPDALRLIDTSSGSVVARVDYDPIGDWQAAIAPDARTVALKRCGLASAPAKAYPINVASRIDIVSLETRAVVETLRLENDEPCGSRIAFSGDGSRLIEDHPLDDAHGGARIWDVATGERTAIRVATASYELLPFPGDRTALLVADGLAARIDLEKLTEVARYARPPRFPICSAVSPDGELVMSASFDGVRVWDARTSTPLSTFVPVRSEEDVKQGVATAAAFSLDGKLLAVAEARSVHLYDPRSGSLVRRWPVPKQATIVRFIDHGTLASADSDGAITLWDVRDGRALATDTRSRATISDLRAFDGVVISASRDTGVRLLTVPAERAPSTHLP